jgi:hypothetical protein
MRLLMALLVCVTIAVCTFIIDRGMTQRSEIELRTAAKLDEVSKRSDKNVAELTKQVEMLKSKDK